MSSEHEKPMIRWHLDCPCRDAQERNILLNVCPHKRRGQFCAFVGIKRSPIIMKWFENPMETHSAVERKTVLSSFLSSEKCHQRLRSLTVLDTPFFGVICTLFIDEKAIFVFTEDHNILKVPPLAGIGMRIADVKNIITMIAEEPKISIYNPSKGTSSTGIVELFQDAFALSGAKHFTLARSIHGIAAVYCSTIVKIIRSFPGEKQKSSIDTLKEYSANVAAACVLLAHAALLPDVKQRDLPIAPEVWSIYLESAARLGSLLFGVHQVATSRYPFEGRLKEIVIECADMSSHRVIVDEFHHKRIQDVARSLGI